MRKTKTKTPQSVVKKSKLLYNKCEINSNLSLVNNISNIVDKSILKFSLQIWVNLLQKNMLYDLIL